MNALTRIRSTGPIAGFTLVELVVALAIAAIALAIVPASMVKLHEFTASFRASGRPLLGVCLVHQFLALHEGLTVAQQTSSTQGMPMRVTVDGKKCRLGFYNSFSPVMDGAAEQCGGIDFDCDDKNRIIAMRGAGFSGFQFHPESVMSIEGVELLYNELARLVQAAQQEKVVRIS